MKLLKITIAFIALVSLQIAAAQWLNVPPPAEARNLMVVGGGVVSAPSALCSSCTPGDPADVFCEDFAGSTECASGEASVCRCAWSAVSQTNGSVVFASNGLTITATTAGDAIVGTNRSLAGETQVYVKFKLNIVSESLADGNSVKFCAVENASGTNDLSLRQTSSQYYLDLKFGANTITGTTAITGVNDTIEMFVNEAGETMQLWVNGTSQGTTTSNYEALATLSFDLYNPVAVLSIRVSDIQVDNDTRP